MKGEREVSIWVIRVMVWPSLVLAGFAAPCVVVVVGHWLSDRSFARGHELGLMFNAAVLLGLGGAIVGGVVAFFIDMLIQGERRC